MGHAIHHTRLARAILALVVTAGAFAFPATPARAWSNGGGDGYGTHDWVIDQALRVLDGRVDGWFDAQTARLATDDPDTIERTNVQNHEHEYHERGRRGGGIDRVATEFDKAQAAYAAGDYRDASYHIGLLAHIYMDLLQPYHTAYAAIRRDVEHHQFEQAVAPLTRHAGDMPAWRSDRRTVSTFANIRTKAIAAARYSRSFYPTVHRLFGPNPHHLSPKVRAIIGKLFRRAANDLADVIWSVQRGTGAQPKVGSLRLSVKWVGVKSGERHQAAFVKVRDVNGKPIEGMKVVVTWPTSTGTRTETLFTNPNGYQMRKGPVGTSPKLKPLDVVATTTVRDQVKSTDAWWAITPVLRSGGRGFKTRVDDDRVFAGQTVTVTTTARDSKGRPVPNLLVTWTWNFDGRKVRTKGVTDATGRARSSQLITSSTPKTRVEVTAHTQSASRNRYSSADFKRVR
jgi:hypothetical protein